MQLAHIPRRRYTLGPTPLEFLPRLTEHLGGPQIYIKRDDLLGLASGGNKTRKLEFLIADALNQGADTIITTGAVQSNHCRLTLAAAVKEGLRCRLVLEERVEGSYHPQASGNNLLFKLLGAEEITVVPGGTDLAKPCSRSPKVSVTAGKAVHHPRRRFQSTGSAGLRVVRRGDPDAVLRDVVADRPRSLRERIRRHACRLGGRVLRKPERHTGDRDQRARLSSRSRNAICTRSANATSQPGGWNQRRPRGRDQSDRPVRRTRLLPPDPGDDRSHPDLCPGGGHAPRPASTRGRPLRADRPHRARAPSTGRTRSCSFTPEDRRRSTPTLRQFSAPKMPSPVPVSPLVGILGGMGPAATVDFYSSSSRRPRHRRTRSTCASSSGRTPACPVGSAPSCPVVKTPHRGWLRALSTLMRSGADPRLAVQHGPRLPAAS